jgi:hypothetical protein
MKLNVLRFLGLLLTALSLAAGVAHVLALPNKIDLPRDDYFAVQQIYRGWALMGIVLFGALISTLAWSVAARRNRREFVLALTAAACIVSSLAVFFLFTFPANQQTDNWTSIPDNWRALRVQWEYSHVVAAALFLAALIALILSVLAKDSSRLSAK